ncbi:alpha-1A adrenergic receptor-like [Sinocyclocheilus grahami]|uniref:alpha-1A adrenergic receptor-like n=1 Tax=Sinocyclocheilus grahami TaxID=75366 RepID=UPI0007AD5158|nr:PREDICTED: alpha-1A adrenergic receptor-like [Sinocyclocheilus grahami]
MEVSDWGVTNVDNQTVQYCFPDNNLSCTKSIRPEAEYIVVYIFVSITSVFTVFLNLLVIVSISHFKQLHTPTNVLILSLAVADLIAGLILMPVQGMKLIEPCWYFGEIFCSIFPLILYVVVTASLGNLVIISVDRYIAVNDPLRYPLKVNTNRVVVSIVSFGPHLHYQPAPSQLELSQGEDTGIPCGLSSSVASSLSSTLQLGGLSTPQSGNPAPSQLELSQGEDTGIPCGLSSSVASSLSSTLQLGGLSTPQSGNFSEGEKFASLRESVDNYEYACVRFGLGEICDKVDSDVGPGPVKYGKWYQFSLWQLTGRFGDGTD